MYTVVIRLRVTTHAVECFCLKKLTGSYRFGCAATAGTVDICCNVAVAGVSILPEACKYHKTNYCIFYVYKCCKVTTEEDAKT